jgi:hypothetical protein
MKLVQQMPGGDNIKSFTRIMHRTTDDDLVGEVRARTTAVIQLQTKGSDRQGPICRTGTDSPT